MLRITYIVLIALLIAPCISIAGTIDVNIKGVDDGVKTTKQQDYKETVLFAKREAIERAGVKVKALTTAKDFVVQSDYIESDSSSQNRGLLFVFPHGSVIWTRKICSDGR